MRNPSLEPFLCQSRKDMSISEFEYKKFGSLKPFKSILIAFEVIFHICADMMQSARGGDSKVTFC